MQKLSKGIETAISKKMSFLLRHGAEKEGLSVSADGYIPVNEILNHPSLKKLKVNEAMISYVVQNNDKQRFELNTKPHPKTNKSVKCIRATQGHTMEVVKSEELLDRITNPFFFKSIVHGTYLQPLDLILKNGLSKMSRNHIHFAPFLPDKQKTISGMRRSCEVGIEINLNKAVLDGIPFFISTNEVVLTEGIPTSAGEGMLPPSYFNKVWRLDNGQILAESPLDFLIILDFQANCTDDPVKIPLKFNQIIEFPVVVIDLRSKKVIAQFQKYIKPTVEPKLTQFCTKLTGITQDQVDEGVKIEKALMMLHEFLLEKGILSHHFTFATCGDYDLNGQLKRESQFKNIPIPNYLRKYINLKKVFPTHKYKETYKEFIYSNINQVKKPQISGMQEMLKLLELELKGKHHSGIDDCRNLANIAIKLMQDGFKFQQKHIHHSLYDSNPDLSRYNLDLKSLVKKVIIEEEKKEELPTFMIHQPVELKEEVKRAPLPKDNTSISYYSTLLVLNFEYNYKEEGEESEDPIKLQALLWNKEENKIQNYLEVFIAPQKLSKQAQSFIDPEEMLKSGVDTFEEAIQKLKQFLGKENAYSRRTIVISSEPDVSYVLGFFKELKITPKIFGHYIDFYETLRSPLNRGIFDGHSFPQFYPSLFSFKHQYRGIVEGALKIKMKSNNTSHNILEIMKLLIDQKATFLMKFMKSI